MNLLPSTTQFITEVLVCESREKVNDALSGSMVMASRSMILLLNPESSAIV